LNYTTSKAMMFLNPKGPGPEGLRNDTTRSHSRISREKAHARVRETNYARTRSAIKK